MISGLKLDQARESPRDCWVSESVGLGDLHFSQVPRDATAAVVLEPHLRVSLVG